MDEGTNGKMRKFLVPGAATVIGTGAGLMLTRKDKLKDALPSFNGAGLGDLAEDLKSKIGSVTGTSDSGGGERTTARSGSRRTLNSKELEQRRRKRADRRKQRAGR